MEGNKVHFKTRDNKYVGYMYENQYEVNDIDLAPTITVVVRNLKTGYISQIGGMKNVDKAKDMILHMFSSQVDYNYRDEYFLTNPDNE